MSEYLCGSICTKYICDELNINHLDMNKSMSWISELALYLNKKNLDLNLYCNNSNLYTDFIKGNYDSSFSGFKYLEDLLKNNISIETKVLTNNSLKNELDNSDYIIMCVESKVFNNDNSFTGGHFIVLTKRDEENVEIINPTIDNYETNNLNIDFLVKCCKNYGEWRLLIRRK